MESRLPKPLVAERLRAARHSAELTVRQLATAIGVSHGYVSAVERGRQIPTARRVVEFAKSLNLNADELCRLAGYVPPDVVEMLKARPALNSVVRAAQEAADRR